VINEVRASVCSPSARRTSSMYPVTLSKGRSAELLGAITGRDGSNGRLAASSGVPGREHEGVGGRLGMVLLIIYVYLVYADDY
jgi:hypothetical protein